MTHGDTATLDHPTAGPTITPAGARLIEANGCTLCVDERGEGEPLVLIMGLGGQLVAWTDDVVDAFVDRGFRVVRFDNRDVGLSSKVDAPAPGIARLAAGLVRAAFVPAAYLIDDMAADAAGVLDALGIDAAHVVGVSMGGMIAQALTIGHPHRVRSLTSIMSHTGDRRHGRISVGLLPAFARLSRTTPDNAVERNVELFRRISGPGFDEDQTRHLARFQFDRCYDPDGVARQSAAIAASPDRTEGLNGVGVPTLVVHGLLDRLVLPSGGMATARAVPGARLLMYPDMGHDVPATRRTEIVEAITANTRRAQG